MSENCDSQVNCSSGDVCVNRRFGSFTATGQSESIGETNDCAPQTSWHFKHTVSPDNAETEKYDRIDVDKIVWLNSFFDYVYGEADGPPGNRLEDDCEYTLRQQGIDNFSYPVNVSYFVKHAPDAYLTDYTLEHGFPQEFSDVSETNGRVVDIISSVLSTGHPLADVAGSVIKYYLDGWENSQFDYDENADSQSMHWDLNYDSSKDYPLRDNLQLQFRSR